MNSTFKWHWHYGYLSVLVILISCMESKTTEDAIIGFAEDGDISEFIEPDQLLAYIVENEQVIYVANGAEQTVAEEMGAEIKGQTWYLKEDNGAGREKKELKWADYHPRMIIVKWTYLRGFRCLEKEKGEWINVTDKRNRFIRSYQTTEKGWWCMREDGACKIILKEVTGDFWTKQEGKGTKRTETRKLSACTP